MPGSTSPVPVPFIGVTSVAAIRSSLRTPGRSGRLDRVIDVHASSSARAAAASGSSSRRAVRYLCASNTFNTRCTMSGSSDGATTASKSP
jgi:hypothetical protein